MASKTYNYYDNKRCTNSKNRLTLFRWVVLCTYVNRWLFCLEINTNYRKYASGFLLLLQFCQK